MGPRADHTHELSRVVSPAPIAAALVLALNDHLLKASPLAGPVTGKLSDIAGVFLLPVLGAAITAALWRRSRIADAVWCAVTAIAFVALKTAPPFNAWVESWWGVNVLDPTDLLALPMTALAWIHLEHAASRNSHDAVRLAGRMRRSVPNSYDPLPERVCGDCARGRRRRVMTRLAVVAAAGAVCIATPAPRPPPPMPFAAWQVTADAERDVGCVRGRAWVSKSGKTGVGLTLYLANPSREAPCAVTVEGASLEVAGTRTDAAPVNARSAPDGGDGMAGPHALEPCGETWVYVPFELDNEASWNRLERDGVFRVTVRTTGEAITWSMPAEHRMVQPPFDGRQGPVERRVRPGPCSGASR